MWPAPHPGPASAFLAQHPACTEKLSGKDTHTQNSGFSPRPVISNGSVVSAYQQPRNQEEMVGGRSRTQGPRRGATDRALQGQPPPPHMHPPVDPRGPPGQLPVQQASWGWAVGRRLTQAQDQGAGSRRLAGPRRRAGLVPTCHPQCLPSLRLSPLRAWLRPPALLPAPGA